MTINNKVFWHVATIGDWEEVVEEQAALIEGSGLMDVAEVHVCKVGPANWTPRRGMHLSLDLDLIKHYEFPTLRAIHQESQNSDGHFLYLHTKGVSKTQEHWDKYQKHYTEKLHIESLADLQRHEKEWRQYMQHFLVRRFKDCLSALADHDLVGVSWRPEHHHPHFSGNFWWARGDYLRGLDDPYRMSWITDVLGCHRAGAEFWVGSGSPRARSLFDAKHNLYSWGISKQTYMKVLM